MKKAFKIISLTVLIVLTLLIGIPFAFQSQIQDLIKQFINQNLNAQVEFDDVSLSFIKSFPQAQVSISDLEISNFAPFKDETLAAVKDIDFTMSLKELFKIGNEEPIIINSIYLNEVLLTLKTDSLGHTNYDITKENINDATTEEETSNFVFSIRDYSINNSTLTYIDEISKMLFHITDLNHEGHGTFSSEISELNTTSNAHVSFIMDSTKYLSNIPIKLDALINLDLANNKYTFKDNKGLINDLPLHFEGYIKQLDNGQEMDISFENPESDFKNFLAIIPKTHSKNIEAVETTGDFKIKGLIKGISSDETIPTLDISITSNNASFKYPELPKRVSNITINTVIKNSTGRIDDTYIDIKALDFKIDKNVFKSSATLKNIANNMMVNAHIDGTLNLGDVSKVYPIALEHELHGILKGNLNTRFDMNALDTNAYDRIKNDGSASITDFVFYSEDMVNPMVISEAKITFNPTTVNLDSFKATTGESDIDAEGSLNNFLGFLFSYRPLKGQFKVNSNFFRVSDFTSEDEASTTNKNTEDSESLKIPDFLDCTINAKAETVVYDNLNLKSLQGNLYIKNQKATLENMTSSIFDGALSLSGAVSTKEKTPSFSLNLKAKNFDISKSFNALELFQNLAPIAKILDGKLNTDLNLSGHLNKDFSPDLNTLSGDAKTELLANKIGTNQDDLITKLDDALRFIDFSKLDLKALKVQVEFADGQVAVKPFDFKYKDIDIEVSGTHGFDKTINYNAVFHVPATYLGGDINKLIKSINDNEINKISIPVTANIGGTYTNPAVKSDLSNSVSVLSEQLIEIQKQKLLNQGKDEVNILIHGVIGGNQTKTDSIKKEQNNTLEHVLNDFMKSNNTSKDSTKTGQTSGTVKTVLGGLFKKKKTDTVN
ncbi:AsmA-like C-terminal region-containing protein [Algibacter mikhailovii]|nr:AsmA-like C-terminal region-containing protein [Algibacter mikhailovii]